MTVFCVFVLQGGGEKRLSALGVGRGREVTECFVCLRCRVGREVTLLCVFVLQGERSDNALYVCVAG